MSLPALSAEVIAILQRDYGKPADEVVARIVHRNAPKVETPRKPSKLAERKAQQRAEGETPRVRRTGDTLPATFLSCVPDERCNVLPPIGTYDARRFLVVMRQATTRDDQIRAIAGFIGYDRQGDFGAQCLSAKMTAQRTMRPVRAFTASQAPHTVQATITGYITGACDERAKRRADTQGRIRLANETLLKLATVDKGEATPEMISDLAALYECPPKMITDAIMRAALVATETRALNELTAQLATL